MPAQPARRWQRLIAHGRERAADRAGVHGCEQLLGAAVGVARATYGTPVGPRLGERLGAALGAAVWLGTSVGAAAPSPIGFIS